MSEPRIKEPGCWIQLGPDEVAIARLVGSRRYQSARRAGSDDVHYAHDANSEQQDQHAVGAELAVARKYDRYPSAFRSIGSDNKSGDVGRLQVRHTEWLTGSLLIYEESADDQAFMLVVGQLPRFRIVGWCYAREAKTQERWRERWPSGEPMFTPCWVVSQRDPILRLITES